MSPANEIDPERVRLAVRALTRVARLIETTDSELSLAQHRMLAQLSHGGERSARLADALRVRKPTVTALADGLIRAGLVVRTTEQGDRRVVRLELTGAGRAALDRADRAYVDRLEPILASLDRPERFVDDLLELRAALEGPGLGDIMAGQEPTGRPGAGNRPAAAS